MSWTGPLLGASALLAVAGALGVALLSRSRWMLLSLVLSLLGVAGACVAVGAAFVAVFVLVAMVLTAAASLGAAIAMAPPAEPDRRQGPRALLAVAAGVGVFLALGLVLARTGWPAAGGPLQLSPEWLGSRLLIDHSFTLLLMAAALSLAGMGGVALLRPRNRR